MLPFSQPASRPCWSRWGLVCMAVLLVGGILFWQPAAVWRGTQAVFEPGRQSAYRVIRGIEGKMELKSVEQWPTVSQAHVIVYYPPGNQADAQFVSQLAETDYQRVTRDLGYHPAGQVPLIMRSSSTDLNKALGLSRGQGAEGVYWGGVVQVLSPRALFPTLKGTDRQRAYAKAGPMAHELTHYVLDAMTSGNYPVWYTEGVAQYEEYRITGWQWIDGTGDIRPDLIPPGQLTSDFDQLSNTAVAYREAFLLVRFMVAKGGSDTLHTLDTRLAGGQPFETAFRAATGGHTLVGWWPVYRQWLKTQGGTA